MNKKVAVIISPNYKDYAKKYLAECFNSLKKQDYAGEMKIFIADNESTEESYNYLKSILPEAEIIRNQNNGGFAKANNDCLKSALKQGYDYLFCLNMDTVLEKDCVGKMAEEIENNKEMDSRLRGNDKEKNGNDKREIGAVQARLMLYNDKNKINSLGNVTHFLGFGYAGGYGENYTNPPSDNKICYPSGAAVLFKRGALEKVGLFDEKIWMYNEDQDLGWRLWLYGFKCVLAPEAVVYHKYEFSRSIKKYYFMDRNRIIATLKNYHWATLLLLAPAFLIMEIGLIFFAAKGGWLEKKIEVYKYFLKLKHWRYILRERKKIQKSRIAPDKEIIKLFSGRIWYQEIGDAKLKIANVFFNAYWRVVKVLIRW
ncbi:MAG: glycosyltransferase family 2 protein [Patescibacteria group bacterium]|nr:glycosyltransferase family 2 protein [Patescibacteria group bacterium]